MEEGLTSKGIESTINEIKEDCKMEDCNRDLLLASCVKNRLSERSIAYNERFDYFISRLEHDFDKEGDLVTTSKILKNYSNLISKLYSQLIDVIERYQKLM